MWALISDIHGNLEAFQAVLEDISHHDVSDVFCLGDVVGYGPNPRECVDLVMECRLTILGNHDQGAIFDPKGFHGAAERAIFWTRGQLEMPIPTQQAMEARWDFLGERPQTHREEGLLFVHGSPRKPLNEYVFPEDVYNERKMEAIFSLVERYCFHGHTHVPGIITESGRFFSPEEIDYAYQFGDEKVMCNVGSVGQPRDGDWRACYALFDGEYVYYRRLEYDIQSTMQKIYDVDDLDDFLADRLPQGR